MFLMNIRIVDKNGVFQHIVRSVFIEHYKSTTFTQKTMVNEGSVAADETDGSENVEKTSVITKGAGARRRTNIRIVQSVLLV